MVSSQKKYLKSGLILNHKLLGPQTIDVDIQSDLISVDCTIYSLVPLATISDRPLSPLTPSRWPPPPGFHPSDDTADVCGKTERIERGESITRCQLRQIKKFQLEIKRIFYADSRWALMVYYSGVQTGGPRLSTQRRGGDTQAKRVWHCKDGRNYQTIIICFLGLFP